MADYHAILKRAISSLPSANGEARRAVYEKARSALVNQLKAFDPPLTPSEITQQRLQLEEAIRKVESEAAKGLLKPTPAVPPVLPPDAAAAAAHQPAPQTPPPAAHADAPAHEVPARPPVVDDAPSRETPPHVSGPTIPTRSTSSTSTRPPSTRPTSTARAAPRAPGPRDAWSPSSWTSR